MTMTGALNEAVCYEVAMARVAVAMFATVARTFVTHMPVDYRLRLRAGANSGPLTSIVGVHDRRR
jgi:hypothetical protein